ncbi:anti-lipopolysaccharide factor [Hyalella azteca]|uniref:Anti-lipopolysaccharide factor n=1 Tax=Hyalella azteca TaxID=294128 RepID=A0A6A0GP23_HYAAZ|nr:anti-lipopolysaccharide factor [Hyalella azteca]KAA0183448.1 anti-lipopolysaccharide factor [Hyalella azteca]
MIRRSAVLLLLLLMQLQSYDASDLNSILPIAQQLGNFWQSNELQFLGFQCYYHQHLRFRRWRFRFHGSFSCPGWTNIHGEYDTVSRNGVQRKTIEDFLKKATAANLVTEDEARAWLQGF